MTINPILSFGNLSVENLPPLSVEEANLSVRLKGEICARIHTAGGALSFAEFMRMALYEPGYGYYVAGQTKFGEQGDFITAPELSCLFSYALAGQCAEVLANLGPEAAILEFGGGSGCMAAAILSRLEQLECLPASYWILDLSPELRNRQQALLETNVPHLCDRVKWLQTLEGFSMTGVVLANEVLDAMPVQRFYRGGTEIAELSVTERDGNFTWQLTAAPKVLQDAVIEIERARSTPLPEAYVSEVNLNIEPWFAALAACLNKGVAICIDYGYPRREYYFDERSQGTLMCHYRHYAHPDPFLNPGIQDITAHVDFTALAEAAVYVGFELCGFTTQNYFLLANGLDALLENYQREVSEKAFLKLSQQAKSLLLPSEMGERFKVMGFSRAYDKTLRGFGLMDFSHRL